MIRISIILIIPLWLPSVAFSQSIEIVSPNGDSRIYAPLIDKVTVQIDRASAPLAIEIEPKSSLSIEIVEKEVIDVITKPAEPITAEGAADTLEVVFSRKPAPEPDPINDALEAGETLRIFGIEFKSDSHAVAPEARQTLKGIGLALQKDHDLRVVVTGHTDNRGSVEYNKALSFKRAEAVRQALVDWYGVEPNRLNIDGRGLADPIESNETNWGRARNRRVEITALP